MGDRYTILGAIANGGMAQVYLARMVAAAGFSRLVAIKRLHDRMSSDREFIAMLLDEARLTAQIRHTNVVDILDLVVKDGTFALVLEWVEGASLSALCKRSHGTPIPPAVSLAILQGVLRGLVAAHEARSEDGEPLGIVHRDVSPQNVLVGVDGIPRIIDFGVAKAFGKLEETRPGEIRGKYGYMAPEQLMGRPVTAQADVYAAGVMFWELLTGKRLFKADDERVVCAAVLRGDIMKPSLVRPDLPEGIDDVVLRAVAREPSSRYLDAREMLTALEPFGRASEDEVGAWVRSLVSEELEAHQRLIRSAVPPAARSLDSLLQELDEPSSSAKVEAAHDRARSGSRASFASFPGPPPFADLEQTHSTTAISSNVFANERGGFELRRPPMPLLVAAGVFATLALVGLVLGGMTVATSSSRRAAAAEASPPPAPTPVGMSPLSTEPTAPAPVPAPSVAASAATELEGDVEPEPPNATTPRRKAPGPAAKGHAKPKAAAPAASSLTDHR